MIRFIILISSCHILYSSKVIAQDSTRYLNEVTVSAFRSNRPLAEVAGAVATLDSKSLNRFSNTNLLPAVNTIPGIRMEERSPGSYRFSVRGSLLRSPFGVRNVKFYWNGLPLTDGGGNTYLNLLDFNAIGSMEIIKGPGASLYGAGTGGVVLLNSPPATDESSQLSVQVGSDGLFRLQASKSFNISPKSYLNTRVALQQADGYREQSAMSRMSAGVDWRYAIGEKSTLTTSYLYSNLYYETPGGLTKDQFEADPRQARPRSGPFPGSAEQQASVTNKTHLVSSLYETTIQSNILVNIGAIASYTDFANPTIRNYEERTESNIGARTEIQYQHKIGDIKNKIILGGEYQYFYSPITVSTNSGGTLGTLQTEDLLKSSGGLAFVQSEADLTKNIFVTLGASVNMLRYDLTREFPAPSIQQIRNFSPALFPRLGLVKQFNRAVALHASISSGFSPPSLAEVRPSTGTFNNILNPETGLNTELGIRGKIKKRLSFDLSVYSFRLKEAIVIQRNADGAEYFVNAGELNQQGLELSLNYPSIRIVENLLQADLFLTYASQQYFFNDYVQDGNDYTDNRVTGVAPNTLSAGIDLLIRDKFYVNGSAYYYDHIPLNDANSVYAPFVWIVNTRVGYKHSGKLPFEVFVTADNLLSENYSLGHDLNAIGGRYYNAAAKRNYSLGLIIKPTLKRGI